jgi:hypothetical protein
VSLISITHYLYRKSARRAIATLITVFVPFAFALAQGRTQHTDSGQAQPTFSNKKAKRGPRAIAVVEFLPNGSMRLVPIALWIEGRYYDASLYGANPEPLAIEPETVYEAQSLGEPTGTFTITTPQQVNGAWIADGSWHPHSAMDDQLAAQAAKAAALKSKSASSSAIMTGEAEDGRPVLKRAPGSTGDSTSTSQPAPATNSDPDRPVMKKPAPVSSSKPTMGTPDEPPASAPPASAETQSPVNDNDPDRPVFKKPAAPAAQPENTNSGSSPTAITQAAATSDDSDPNRPVLSHTKTTKPVAAPAMAPASAKADAASSHAPKTIRAYPAISDAGQYPSRPLLYSMTSGERQVFEQQAVNLAMNEIRAFATKRNGPPIPKTATLTDYEVRAFDLEYSSSPTLVLTGKLPMAGAEGPHASSFNYFVSIVARVDINDQTQKIFASVTDSNHLDAFPRMELIDAVDADANGRGDLLFRQYSDNGISYGLYRVSAYQVEKIFEGGSSL